MRLAIFSDIHEDLDSLGMILKQIKSIGSDAVVCLGDISGFSDEYYSYADSRDASGCLDLLRENCDIIISGNHDLHACECLPVHSAIFDFPSDWYQLDIETQLKLSNDSLWLQNQELDPGYSEEEMLFLRSLPEYHILDNGESKILLSHYAYPNLSGLKKGFYSWRGDFKGHMNFMQEKDCAISITGHAHPTGMFTVTKKSFKQYSYRKISVEASPLIIGIPPVTRQGNRSGFCILDTETQELSGIRTKH